MNSVHGRPDAVNGPSGGDNTADAVTDRILFFQPQGPWRDRWFDCQDTVRAWVARCGFVSAESVSPALSIAARFCAWALDQGRPLAAEQLLTPDVIRHYVATEFDAYADNTAGTVASTLERLARANTARAPWRPPATRTRTRLQPPYSQAEVAQILAAAKTIRHERRARIYTTITLTTLGIGSTPSETQRLNASDIRRTSTGVVLVTLGPDRRVVPAQPQYAKALVALSQAYPGETLVDVPATARSRMGDLCRYCRPNVDDEPLNMARLRSTWLAEVLLTLPLPEVMHRANITHCAHLADLLAGFDRRADGSWTRG